MPAWLAVDRCRDLAMGAAHTWFDCRPSALRLGITPGTVSHHLGQGRPQLPSRCLPAAVHSWATGTEGLPGSTAAPARTVQNGKPGAGDLIRSVAEVAGRAARLELHPLEAPESPGPHSGWADWAGAGRWGPGWSRSCLPCAIWHGCAHRCPPTQGVPSLRAFVECFGLRLQAAESGRGPLGGHSNVCSPTLPAAGPSNYADAAEL